MKNTDKLIQSAFTAFLMLAASHCAIAEGQVDPSAKEKCYGIVKMGMNDCATATASCAGSATKDNQADAFVFMTTGLCEKLVGGKLKPAGK